MISTVSPSSARAYSNSSMDGRRAADGRNNEEERERGGKEAGNGFLKHYHKYYFRQKPTYEYMNYKHLN